MVHMGSFLAVITYFWRDVLALTIGALNLLRGRVTDHGRLGLLIVVATIPAVIFGLFAKKTGVIDAVRGPEIVAWNAIIFGVLMYFADRFGKHVKVMENMTFMPALLIGLAQAVAIIPGTSRSGITMTAARFLGFQRPEAARFSFLVGIPAIAGAGVLVLGEAISNGATISGDAITTGVLTFFYGPCRHLVPDGNRQAILADQFRDLPTDPGSGPVVSCAYRFLCHRRLEHFPTILSHLMEPNRVHSARRGAKRDTVYRASTATTPMGGFGPPKAGLSRPLDYVTTHLWSTRPRRRPCLASRRENPVK